MGSSGMSQALPSFPMAILRHPSILDPLGQLVDWEKRLEAVSSPRTTALRSLSRALISTTPQWTVCSTLFVTHESSIVISDLYAGLCLNSDKECRCERCLREGCVDPHMFL